MAGTTLGTAYVQIRPSAEGMAGSIASVMSGEASAAGEKTGGLFSRMFSSKTVKGFAIAGAALATGVGLGTAALKKGITETAAYGDNVDKMSQKIGFTTDEYQKWDYVLQRAGTDITKMGPAMKTLSTQATSNSAAFQELGISQEQLATMSPGELFSETVTKLSQMEDATQRTALASKLLGRGATELGPLFNEGTAAIEEQMEMAEKYGMIMPEEAVKASAAFQDSVTTMQMTFTGLKNRMMAEFLPAVTQITDGLGKMFAGDMSGVDDVANGINGVIAKLGEMAPVVLQAAIRLGSQLVQGIASRAPDIAAKAGHLMGVLITGFINRLPSIMAAAVKLISSFARGLLSQLPSVLSAVTRIGSQLVRGLGSAIWGKVKAAAQGVVRYFMQPITSLIGKVKDVVNKIKGLFPFNIGKIIDFKLPHISLKTGSRTVLGKSITYPTGFDVSWYAKGGIFNRPTLLSGVGEAGPEAVLPLKPFWDKMDRMAESVQAGSGVTINVYGSPGMDVKALAKEVRNELINVENRRRLAWQ